MSGAFRSRNAYYLRISRRSVLPLYLYLDDRHIDWMTDRVLQLVLADLKPLIPPKLEAEADAHLGPGAAPNAKKGSVDVHRGEHYQFAFFFRKTEPHSVLIKTRDFVLAPPVPKVVAPPMPQPPTSKAAGKRRSNAKAKSAAPRQPANAKKRRATKSKFSRAAVDSEEESAASSDDDRDADRIAMPPPPRPKPRPVRSTRARIIPAGGYREEDEDEGHDVQGASEVPAGVEMREVVEATPAPESGTDPVQPTPIDATVIKREDPEQTLSPVPPSAPSDMVIDIDEDEEIKPKPILQLKYKGFDIAGRCLCVVVEPWPAIRFATRAPSLALSATSRASSIAPQDFVTSAQAAARARTPLFLPDDDDEPRGRSQTPFVVPTFPQRRILPPVPAFDDPADSDEDENAELMQFSQALKTASRYRTGDGGDDDEMDGGVLFGDADEVREL